jgi:sugar phosphate isomerase/epimerase
MSGENPEVDADLAKSWLQELGMECCATHRSWNQLSTSLDEEILFHKALDCKYVAVPGIGQEFGVVPDSYQKFLAEAEPIARNLEKHGMMFGFHNHAHEFACNPETGRPCIELLSRGPCTWLQMEVDTYWVAEAGVCPADFLAECNGRIYAIHVKDREIIPGEGAVMAPVGSGNLNWESILEVCRSGDCEWLIVEQDTCRTDPFACLRSSFQFLSRFV